MPLLSWHSMHHVGSASIHIQFGLVSGALRREGAHASPVIGRACITWAMHQTVYQFLAWQQALSVMKVLLSLLSGIGRASHEHRPTHQFGIVASALSNESSHASPVISRAYVTWASHRSMHQFSTVARALSNGSAQDSRVGESTFGCTQVGGWVFSRRFCRAAALLDLAVLIASGLSMAAACECDRGPGSSVLEKRALAF